MLGESAKMFDFLILLGLSLFVRLFPVRNAITSFDTYGHLYYAKEVKNQKAGPWGSILPNCWGAEEYRHPFLWHWLIGMFSIDKVLVYQRWINPAIDAIFSICIYYLLMSTGLGQVDAMLGMMLYLFTPMWFSSASIGPRISSLTPRFFSELCLNGMYIVLFIDLGLPAEWQFVAGTVLASAIILSSKFGTQALLFLTPIVASLTLSLTPVFVVVSGLGLSVFLTKGEIVLILKRQLVHLVNYYRTNANASTAISDRNKIAGIMKNSNGKTASWRQVFIQLVLRNSYTSVLIKMPILVITMLLVIINYTVAGQMDFMLKLSPVLAAVFVYFLINRPKLLFLGEAERYLNHVAVFIVISAVSLAIQVESVWLLWVLIAYGVFFWLLEAFFISRHSERILRAEADDLVETFLKSHQTPLIVLSYPYHSGGVYRIMLNTIHKVIFPIHINSAARESFVNQFEPSYPYINLGKLDELTKITGVDTVIVDRKKAITSGLNDWTPSNSWVKVQLAQSFYDVYQRISFNSWD
jgi:hypothetical protein